MKNMKSLLKTLASGFLFLGISLPLQAGAPDPALAEKNLTTAKLFFEENKKKSDIITLPSGLQYKIVSEGSGTPAGPTDFVTVRYRGTLLDGTEFDSSLKNTTTFAVNAVIAGFSEALQLMKPNSKWILYIPPYLAYGSRGAGKLVGPNAGLIFEVELKEVKSSLDENKSTTQDEFED